MMHFSTGDTASTSGLLLPAGFLISYQVEYASTLFIEYFCVPGWSVARLDDGRSFYTNTFLKLAQFEPPSGALVVSSDSAHAVVNAANAAAQVATAASMAATSAASMAAARLSHGIL